MASAPSWTCPPSAVGGTFVAAPQLLDLWSEAAARVLLLQTLEVVQVSAAVMATGGKDPFDFSC